MIASDRRWLLLQLAAFFVLTVTVGCSGGTTTMPSSPRVPASLTGGCYAPPPTPVPPSSNKRAVKTIGCDSTPAPAPTESTSNVGELQPVQLTSGTFVQPTDPMANTIVVQAPSRAYFFPSNAAISYANSYLIVRGYDSLWVYPASGVSVRSLSQSSSSPASAFAAEGNATLLSALASAQIRTVIPANDPCADCGFAVLSNIDSVAGLDTEQDLGSMFSLQSPQGVATTCDQAATNSNCGFAAYDDTIGIQTTYAQTTQAAPPAGDGSCLLSGFVYSSDALACVPGTGPSARNRVALASRGAKYFWVSPGSHTQPIDYSWSFHSLSARFICSNPALYTTVMWWGEYLDVWGGFATGSGLAYTGAASRFTLVARPSIPWSIMEAAFWNYNTPSQGGGGQFLGAAAAVGARWTW